jgi:uncharacterized membrane protein YedE/YeeE
MQLSTDMFMGLMFIVGLVLTIFALKIASNVNNCDSSTQNAVRGLLVMGVMLMSITGTTLGINCPTRSKSHTLGGVTSSMAFIVLMLIIGIITTALVSVIHKNCEDARKDTPILLIMSVLIIVVSGGYLGYTVYSSRAIKSKFSFGG